MLDKETLFHLYCGEKKSMQEIADGLNYSLHTVSYWMQKYKIPIRSRSEATYVRRNPGGDPFSFHKPITDPALIEAFIEFLVRTFNLERADFKFGLQLFTDIDPEVALDFWIKKLNIDRSQIGKPVITKSGSIGTYRKKSQYGVLTVMYHNKKLRDLLVSLLPL